MDQRSGQGSHTYSNPVGRLGPYSGTNLHAPICEVCKGNVLAENAEKTMRKIIQSPSQLFIIMRWTQQDRLFGILLMASGIVAMVNAPAIDYYGFSSTPFILTLGFFGLITFVIGAWLLIRDLFYI